MESQNKDTKVDQNRRNFVKRAAYTAPAIMTVAAIPSIAQAGSCDSCDANSSYYEHRSPDRRFRFFR